MSEMIIEKRYEGILKHENIKQGSIFTISIPVVIL